MSAQEIVQRFMERPRKMSAENLRALARQLCVNVFGIGRLRGRDAFVEEVFDLLREEWCKGRLTGDGRIFYVRAAA